MNRIPLVVAALLVGLKITTVNAETADGSSYGVVEEKMRALVPNATTIAVSETPIKGLLQVQVNSDIVYVTEEGQYLLQGQIIDLDTRDNITDQAKSGIRKDLLGDLKPEEQISFTPEEPDYELLVFWLLDEIACRDGEEVETLNEHATFIDNNKDRMRYAGLREVGLPVGSGVTEGACGTVVGDRAKGKGRRWRPEGLDAAFTLRSIYCSDRMPQFCKHLKSRYTATIRAAA